ncbi:phosphoglycolate phosphatase [Pseudomaricurvus alcaniphilus]|nr:phosphoglycolate phosphatase [Pseudomaricurvus alcaniphilus]NHN37030.1 phosphoglycolate phosphatase [Pseudomaricurvus alcaniphilus]
MFSVDFPRRKPELVMFDLDGTLADSVPDLSAAVDEVLLDLGYPAAGEYKARLWVGNGAAALVLRALADALRVPEEQVSPQLHQSCLENFFRRYQHYNGRYTALYPGVMQALQALRAAGVAMAVVTNKPGQFVPQLLQQLGIDEYFRLWLGGDSLAVKKPDPGPLNHILERLGVSPQRALMVGDSVNDIAAARAAGVASVAVAYGYNRGLPVAQDNPDWLTDNLGHFFVQGLAAVAV